MIQANLATYPARRSNLLAVVQAIASQVDVLNVVLNEYSDALAELSEFANVNQIIPEHDTKDAGKFYPSSSGADYVFLIDDDLIYPSDFVELSIARFEALGLDRVAAGYHCSIYYRPKFSLWPRKFREWYKFGEERIADFRKKDTYYSEVRFPRIVDQIATNSALLRGPDMPSYEFMADSQKFVDVRLARWLYMKNIECVSLPKDEKWLRGVHFDETIYRSFTQQNQSHVSAEIMTFAFQNARVGTVLRTGAEE